MLIKCREARRDVGIVGVKGDTRQAMINDSAGQAASKASRLLALHFRTQLARGRR